MDSHSANTLWRRVQIRRRPSRTETATKKGMSLRTEYAVRLARFNVKVEPRARSTISERPSAPARKDLDCFVDQALARILIPAKKGYKLIDDECQLFCGLTCAENEKCAYDWMGKEICRPLPTTATPTATEMTCPSNYRLVEGKCELFCGLSCADQCSNFLFPAFLFF